MQITIEATREESSFKGKKDGKLITKYAVKDSEGEVYFTYSAKIGKAERGEVLDVYVDKKDRDGNDIIKLEGSGGGYNAPQASSSGGGEDRNRSFALAYAKDVGVAHIGQGNNCNILEMAEEFLAWLKGEKKENPVDDVPDDFGGGEDDDNLTF